MTTPGIFTFTAQELSGGPIFNFTLADSAGNTIANSPFSDISGFLEAGSYTLLVEAEVNAPYILSVSRADSGATHDDAGSNDTAITAQPILVAPGTTVMGFIGLMDEDWYSFTLTDATNFFIGANSTTGQTRLSNIEILDSTSTPVPIVAGQVSLAVGSYYLRVSGSTGPGFPDYRVTFGTLPGTLYSSTPALAIPDNAPTNPATDIINVADLCTITNIAVSMNITHTWIGDLAIDLESPAGTTIRLWNRTGGSDDDIIGIFGADLSSAEPLSGFVGEEAQGNWTISVSDSFASDTGVLNSWGVLVDCQ